MDPAAWYPRRRRRNTENDQTIRQCFVDFQTPLESCTSVYQTNIRWDVIIINIKMQIQYIYITHEYPQYHSVGSGVLWCAKNENHTHTHVTHFGSTTGLPTPMFNPSLCMLNRDDHNVEISASYVNRIGQTALTFLLITSICILLS